jgi:hypothetical protein
MDYVGIDIDKNQSQICLITVAGAVLPQRPHAAASAKHGCIAIRKSCTGTCR